MIRAFTCLLTLVCFLLPGYLPAQSSHLQLSPIRLPGQFPGAGIRMAIQDKAGLLWYFTNNGLYRYDGNELLYFGLNTQPALPYSPLFYLQPDGKGNLWIAFNKGAARFDLKNWTITPLHADDWHPYQPLDKNFTAVTCLPGGSVYLATRNGKLYLAKNDTLQKVAEVSVTVNNIAEPVPGQLWLASDYRLINISVNQGKYSAPRYYKFVDEKGDVVPIYKICYDSTGKFLFASDQSTVFRGDVRELYAHRNEASLHPNASPLEGLVIPVPLPEGHADLFRSPFHIGHKYIGLLTGRSKESKRIYTYDFGTSTWQLITPSFAVNFPGDIFYISPYPKGALVASGEGLTSISFQKLPLSLLLNGFDSKNSIRAIYKKGSRVFVGSYRDGFMQYDEQTRKSKSLIPDLNVYSILPWNDDSLLLADEGRGLLWYVPRTNKLSFISIKNQAPKDILKMATVLCRVNDSLVLKGSYQGVNLVNPLKKVNYAVAKGQLSPVMQNLKINAILPVKDKAAHSLGRYLIATNSGTFIFNLDNGHVAYFLADSVTQKIKKAAIFSLLPMQGATWMGSGGFGIVAADSSGRLLSMDWLNSRLTGQMIYSLTRCGNDVLIGTDKGLNILHLKDSTISYYTSYDGLPADEFNQAAVFNNGKEAYLGTVNGIIRWRSTDGEIKKQYPNIHIDNLTIVDANNTKTQYYNFPYLPPDSQRIFIPAHVRYFSLTFGRPGEKNTSLSYSYRLSPDDDWTDLGHKREITFIKTIPGHYRLQFAIKAPGGKWIPDPSTIPLIVEPAFRQTLYFKLLLGLAFAGILFLVFRYRERQKNKERDMRMKIAGDLHDEVGSSLAAIRHQNNRAIQSTSSGIKEIAKPLRAVEEISEKALSVMSDIVWSIDARFDTRDAFVIRMKDHVYSLKNNMGIPVNLKITGNDHEDMKMHQAVRQNLFLIFKEAVNNAMKYGDNSPIDIQLHFDGKLLLKISNNYQVSSTEKQDSIQGGHGLTSMKRRAKRINADLQIKKEEHTFVVSVIL